MNRTQDDWFNLHVPDNGHRGGPSPSRSGPTVVGLPTDNNFWDMAVVGEAWLPEGIEQYPATLVKDAPEPQPRRYAVEGLIPFGAASTLYGDGGSGKSTLALSICSSLARGSTRWLGRDLEPCGALYLDFELTQDEQLRRVYALCRGSGYESVPDNLYYLSAVGKDKESVFWSAYHACAWHGLRFLVIDSLGPALQGEAEKASDVIAFYRAWIEPFVRQGMAVLLVDHQAKNYGSYQQATSFGSVYKRNLVRSEIQVESADSNEADGTVDLTFRHFKHNFGPLARPFAAQLRFRDGEVQVNEMDMSPQRMMRESGIPVGDRVLMALESAGGSLTPQDVADVIGSQKGTVKSVLLRLEKSGKVIEANQTRNGIPMYEISTAPGVRYVEEF